MTEADNILIFTDTLTQVLLSYPANNCGVRYYNGIEHIDAVDQVTPITMTHGGTVSTGYAESDKMRVAILNFADAIKFGGWVELGAQTQEENICRCTNLYPILGSEKSAEMYYIPNRKSMYPRPADDYCHYGYPDEVYTDRIIYARDVTVFKDDTTYENITPKNLDVITCPAPSAQMDGRYAYNVFVNRITQVVFSAIDNGAECIVLGAWGCGAFGQSPSLVAQAFATVLNNYSGYFKKVIFAIKPTPQWRDADVYTTFAQTFEDYFRGGVLRNEE